jgi:ABC-type transport system substrate-binding protein
MVYTFTLYDRLKFADGSPITADSVVASWERTTDPKFKATNPSLYLGDILGVKEKLAGKAASITGLKVIDDRTLQVTLDGAKPYFLAKLRFSTAAIIDVNDADLRPSDWEFTANASGPYKIYKYIKDEAMILERNPNYPVQPAVQYLVYLFEPGGSPISLYEDGTLDLLPIGPADVKRVSSPDDPLHNQVQTVTRMCTDMLLINTDRAPLDDLNVRKALVLAIDKNELNDKYSTSYELVADSILPPAMPGFSQRDPAKFDPAAAKKALAASKYGANLPPIKLVFAGTAGTTPQLAKLLSDKWKKNLGITVTVELEDPANFEKASRSSTGNVFYFGWCADYPDPENFLDLIYHSQSQMNLSLLNNPKVDALLEKARTEMDGATRLQLYQQAETILLDEVDTIPLFNSVLTYLVNPRIKGANIPAIDIDIEPWLSIQ